MGYPSKVKLRAVLESSERLRKMQPESSDEIFQLSKSCNGNSVLKLDKVEICWENVSNESNMSSLALSRVLGLIPKSKLMSRGAVSAIHASSAVR
jgi:hypothetical protein